MIQILVSKLIFLNPEEFKGLSFEEKVELGKEFLASQKVNSERISDSKLEFLGGSPEIMRREFMNFEEEMDMLENVIPSYSYIVKRSPLDIYNGVGGRGLLGKSST